MQVGDPAQALRQGDICAIPHIPIWHVDKASIVNNPDPKSPDSVMIPTWNRADTLSDERSLVVVASQCCDLENPRARVGVLVAPLMRVPARPGDSRYDEIMSSSEEPTDAFPGYRWIQLFPFRVPAAPDFEARDLVADHSALTTMAPAVSAVEQLREGRLFSLDDAERRLFRLKLAAMLGRDPDREREGLPD